MLNMVKRIKDKIENFIRPGNYKERTKWKSYN